MFKPWRNYIELWFDSMQSGMEWWSTSIWKLSGKLDHWMTQSKHSILGEFYSVFGKCVRSVIHSNRHAKAYLWFRKAFPFKRCVHRSSLAGLAKTCPFKKITRSEVSIPVQNDFLGAFWWIPVPFWLNSYQYWLQKHPWFKKYARFEIYSSSKPAGLAKIHSDSHYIFDWDIILNRHSLLENKYFISGRAVIFHYSQLTF